MDSWSGCGSNQSSSALSQTKVVGGKQNSEKVAWFYQPNYTKLAALLLIERQRKSSPANKNHHSQQDLSDKDGNSDSDSCSSGKENNCDNSSSSSTFVNSDVSSNTISNNSPFYPPQEESVSSSFGDDIAAERANFIRSRRSQPISRSGSSETQSSSSSLIAGIQQSDLEKELEMVKEREEREQKEKEIERENEVKSMDTQMSDLEVAEELLSLVRVSASLPYAPIKYESTDFIPTTTTTSIIKTETTSEKENIQIEKENQVNSDVHGNAIAIPNATPSASPNRQFATLTSTATNINSAANSTSTTGSGGPYRRRTNACLEHKRKHQKCPYDCVFKKRAQSPPNGSTSIPTSPPITATTSVPSTPTVAPSQSPSASRVYVSRSPSPSTSSSSSSSPTSPSSPALLPSESSSNSLIADTSPQSASQTHIITPHKEFSSLVTKFLSFGMNVPSLNTFGTQTHLPAVSVPGESLFPKMS